MGRKMTGRGRFGKYGDYKRKAKTIHSHEDA